MSFERAVQFVLEREGGYSHDPADPGGETNHGISKRAYPSLDIAKLTRAEAVGIYKRDYWDKCRCGDLPEGLAILVMDSAVNQGPRVAIQLLQESVGTKVDGIVGPATLMAVRHADADNLLVEYTAQRMAHYGRIPQFHRYGLGWSRRLIACFRLASSTFIT